MDPDLLSNDSICTGSSHGRLQLNNLFGNWQLRNFDFHNSWCPADLSPKRRVNFKVSMLVDSLYFLGLNSGCDCRNDGWSLGDILSCSWIICIDIDCPPFDYRVRNLFNDHPRVMSLVVVSTRTWRFWGLLDSFVDDFGDDWDLQYARFDCRSGHDLFDNAISWFHFSCNRFCCSTNNCCCCVVNVWVESRIRSIVRLNIYSRCW